MQFASSGATLARSTSRSRSALPLSRSLDPPILRATALILLATLFFEPQTLPPHTRVKKKHIRRCFPSKSMQFSTLSAAASELPLERRQRFLHSLARPARVPSSYRSLVVCSSHATQHRRRSFCRHSRSADSCVSRRPSSQARTPHGQRAIRLYAKSALFRQRYPRCWRGNRYALVDICATPLRIFRTFLLDRDAQGRRGASSA